MPEIKINNKTFATQTGAAQPIIANNVQFPAGHIVQTKFRSVSLLSANVTSSALTAFTNNSNQEYYVPIDNLTVGNAVALHFCVVLHIEGSSSVAHGGLGIFRDTTKIYETDNDSFQNYQGTSSAGVKFSTLANILFIDTNFSSTSHTYYLGGRMGTGNFIRVEAGNPSGTTPSTFLAQEIQQ